MADGTAPVQGAVLSTGGEAGWHAPLNHRVGWAVRPTRVEVGCGGMGAPGGGRGRGAGAGKGSGESASEERVTQPTRP